MKVKNLVSWSGENFSYSPGEIIEIENETALARIEAGLAEGIGDAKAVVKSKNKG